MPPREDFIKVALLLRSLSPDTVITRGVFVDAGKRRLWQWAARQGLETSASSRASRSSPWRVFSAGQTAETVLRALPPWVELLQIPAIGASDVVTQLETELAPI